MKGKMRPDSTQIPPGYNPKTRLVTLQSLDGRCKASRRVKAHLDRLRRAAGGRLSPDQQVVAERAAILAALIEDAQVRMLAGEKIGFNGLAWLEAGRRRAERDLAKLIKARPRKYRWPKWAGKQFRPGYEDDLDDEETEAQAQE
jgi:hypothetical protein